MKWISVKDRLPEIGMVCLLYITYPKDTMFNCLANPLNRDFHRVGGLRYDGKFISYEDHYSENGIEYVSHWMPLPELPHQKDCLICKNNNDE